MKIKPTHSFLREAFILKKRLLVLFFCLLSIGIASAQAQTKTITGTVVDELNEPLPSVTIIIKGTSNGTISDFDGNYSINAKVGDVLEISYLGMKTQTITVGAQNTIPIVMKDDATMLAETVVIGYGAAKSKDLTSPISTVKSEDLSKRLTTSPMQGLQGELPGIQVVNTGRPGDSPKVRIRGIGGFDADDRKPLYVVDGMFFDNIDFLNSSDIENFSVLKDASSAAIYGVRAANGVVIITTKRGVTNQKPQITYDGYVGIQQAKNVVKMANSADYIRAMEADGRSSSIEAAQKRYGSVNTDWFKEVLRTAPIHSHSLSIAGGSEKTTYMVSANYLSQEGIMDVDNSYERTNLRAKLDAGITSWLKIGANFGVSNTVKQEADLGVFGNAYTSPSIYPVYDPDNAEATSGGYIDYASPKSIGLSNYFKNPVALGHYNKDNYQRGFKVMPSVYAEFSALESKLTFRTSFSQNISFRRDTKFIPQYTVSSDQKQNESELTKRTYYNNDWVVDNILTYRESFQDKHNFTVMLGNSFRKEREERTNLFAKNVPQGREEYWWLNQGSIIAQDKSDAEKWYDNAFEDRGISFFGRLMYDYQSKYLFSVTMRADGSSKFQEKWGYFPSVGAGWNIASEDFMKDQNLFDALKLRGNWGLLGNDKVKRNPGFAKADLRDVYFDNNAYSGMSGIALYRPTKWEKVDEYDLGVDFAMLNNRLSGSFDYYHRKTLDLVYEQIRPATDTKLLINGADVLNKGFEFTLNWNDKINNDFNYHIGFNVTTLKNEVTYLGGAERNIDFGDYGRVKQIGKPIDAFFGYEVEGVYQTQEEIDNDQSIKGLINKPKPGDFKYKDLDEDGEISDLDRTILGSHIPTLYLGGSLGFSYKNFDFSTSFNGAFGHKILNQKRFMRQKQPDINFDKKQIDQAWTGAGSTNQHPSFEGLNRTWNYSKFNNYFVEKADNFNISNIQAGYTFKNIFKNSNNSMLRLNVTAENPLSFFAYNGFTTDVADGIDLQLYPFSRTISFGVKLVY